MKRIATFVLCASIMLVISGCGSTEVDESLLPTPVPTMDPAIFEETPIATAPEATEAPAEATPEATAVETVEATDEVTATAESSAAETETAPITGTAPITEGAELTATETVTEVTPEASEAITATETVTAPITNTESVTATETVTATATEVEESEEGEETTAVEPTVEITSTQTPDVESTGEITETAEVTATATVTAGGFSGSTSATEPVDAPPATKEPESEAPAAEATTTEELATEEPATEEPEAEATSEPTEGAAGAAVTPGADPRLIGLPPNILAAMETADLDRAQQLVLTNACVGCHSLDPGVTLVGPTWANIANTAATRIPGQSAGLYLYNSIIHPNDYVVEGFAPGLMLQTYGQTLSDQDLADIISYLLTLDSE